MPKLALRTSLGILFALPVTLISLAFYLLPFTAFRWYRYVGWKGVPGDSYDVPTNPMGTAPCWVVDEMRAPVWLLWLWEGWSGHCVGTAIVVRRAPGESTTADTTVRHELHHVHQMHRLGFFQPMLYSLASLCAWASKNDSYVDNPFEVSARRAAKQLVDADSFAQGFAMGQEKTKLKSIKGGKK